MAVVTTNARIQASIDYVKKASNTYVAIGRQTPWTNEQAPPTEDVNAVTLQEVIGYKKVKKVSLCKPIEEGEDTPYVKVEYAGKHYALVPVEKAFQEKTTLVYYESEILGTDLPTGLYRQVGIHTGVTPKTGITKPNLLPSEVQSTGVLEFYENKQFQNRTLETKVYERFILSVSDNKKL